MTIAVVTTSINAQPRALEEWANQPHVTNVIVAGDSNSPRELGPYVDALPGGRYLRPLHQLHRRITDAVPWRSIQRRNFALLEALRTDASHVLVVDDDNVPTVPDWTTRALAYFDANDPANHAAALTVAPRVGSWYDPGTLHVDRYGRTVHARGMPYDVDRADARRTFKIAPSAAQHTAVFQAGVVGDPDVDAMERLVVGPDVVEVLGPITLAPGFCAPINSQSTLWRRDYAPLAAVPPGLGRMDDIWGGLIAQRILATRSGAVVFGVPAVRQDRNRHDPYRDLEQEMLGYRFTTDLVKFIDCEHVDPASPVVDTYRWLARSLRTVPFFPLVAQRFMTCWADDVDDVLNDAPVTT